MATVKMVARSVGRGGNPERAVVRLEGAADPNDENVAYGSAMLTVTDPDELDDFKEGTVYEVTIEAAGDAAAKAQSDAWAAAAAIPNSTNTPRFKTPPELKVPPPMVPDGVVTEPRPSVIMEPSAGAPSPTAGVVSPPSGNPTLGTGAPAVAPVVPAAPGNSGNAPGNTGSKK